MSTDYPILKRDGFNLYVLEHSGVFDVTYHDDNLDEDVDIGERLTVEELCEAGLRFLQVALYNCGDVEHLRTWLHTRVNEVDFGTRTPLPPDPTVHTVHK